MRLVGSELLGKWIKGEDISASFPPPKKKDLDMTLLVTDMTLPATDIALLVTDITLP